MIEQPKLTFGKEMDLRKSPLPSKRSPRFDIKNQNDENEFNDSENRKINFFDAKVILSLTLFMISGPGIIMINNHILQHK